MQNLNLIGPLVSKIWVLKLILICIFKTVPYPLGFEVKHSKFLCISVRAWIILLSIYFTINKVYWPLSIFKNLNRFSNLFVTSPTSQLILQHFRRFTYVTAHSPTLPLLHLRHSSFSNPSFASPTPQALHLIHLPSRPLFFHAPSYQLQPPLYFLFFPRETIKYEINKYVFKFIIFNFFLNNWYMTERGGSVVTHETRIREVSGSHSGADQPDWGFFVVFLNHQGKCCVGFSLPRSIWPLFIKCIYHKIKINELNKWNIDNTTIEIHSLLVHIQWP